MPVLVMRHRVESYETWKQIFDEELTTRQAHGSAGERVFQNVDELDEVLIYLEWDCSERAWLYARSAGLRESMVRARVIDHPDIWIVQERDRTAF